MKKILLILFFPVLVCAQEKNAIKTNLVSPISKIWSVQHEYKLGSRWSFNHTVFFRNRAPIPFSSTIDQVAKQRGLGLTGVDFEYIFVDRAEIGVLGYSPELRFYTSKSKNPSFLGLFGQFERFDLKVPALFLVRYDGFQGEVELPVNFDISTISGGILIGKQWNFGRFLLDFVILGPHFGRANRVDAAIQQEVLGRLNESDKQFLKEKVIERFKLDEEFYQVGIGTGEATINANKKVPYFGLRGFGFNIGYRF